jgi:hypothetical protein
VGGTLRAGGTAGGAYEIGGAVWAGVYCFIGSIGISVF